MFDFLELIIVVSGKLLIWLLNFRELLFLIWILYGPVADVAYPEAKEDDCAYDKLEGRRYDDTSILHCLRKTCGKSKCNCSPDNTSESNEEHFLPSHARLIAAAILKKFDES